MEKHINTRSKFHIVILCDYFKEYKENRASFRIRKNTAAQIAEYGHSVVFIYPSLTPSFRVTVQKKSVNRGGTMTMIETPGFLPIRFRTGGFALLDLVVKAIYVIFYRPDIIQAVTGHRPSNFFPCLISKFIHGNIIVDERWEWLGKGGYSDKRAASFIGRFISYYDQLLELKSSAFFDAVIVISSSLKMRYANQKKIHVMPGGAEKSNLIPYSLKDARKKIDLSHNLFILGLSNMIPADHEDNAIFFKAFRHLIQSHSRLRLLATGTDADYIQEVEQEFGLEGKIIFPGYVPFKEYNYFLSACDVFVLPYPDTPINRGRWPNKIGDYLCLQRPVISNPTGDFKNLFSCYDIGILCEATVDAFSNTIETILKKDSSYFKNLTKDSNFLVQNVLSFEKRIETMLNLFHTLKKG
jgi:glycosyltransferase involved in cell wall biosynthesis